MSIILVIEDNDTMRDGISLILKKEGHQVTEALEGKEEWRPSERESSIL